MQFPIQFLKLLIDWLKNTYIKRIIHEIYRIRLLRETQNTHTHTERQQNKSNCWNAIDNVNNFMCARLIYITQITPREIRLQSWLVFFKRIERKRRMREKNANVKNREFATVVGWLAFFNIIVINYCFPQSLRITFGNFDTFVFFFISFQSRFSQVLLCDLRSRCRLT